MDIYNSTQWELGIETDNLSWQSRTRTLDYSTEEGAWTAFHLGWRLDAPLMWKFLI